MKLELFFLALVLSCAAGFFFIRAISSDVRSNKLGAISAALGASSLIPVLIHQIYMNPELPQLPLVCGTAAVIPAAVAVLLAVWALRLRRQDNVTSPPRYQIAGLIWGVFGLWFGTDLLVSRLQQYALLQSLAGG